MQKLLAAYQKQPSPSNRVRLQRYLDLHYLAICMATVDEIRFLRTHEFTL